MDLNYKINDEQYYIKIKDNIKNEISQNINKLVSDKKIIFLYDINIQKDFRLLYSKESNSSYASIYERILTQ